MSDVAWGTPARLQARTSRVAEVVGQAGIDGAARRGSGAGTRGMRAAAKVWALVGGGAVALVAAHVWLSQHLPDKGPIILMDEGGYLGNATNIAHGFGHPLAGYYGGYSLLLVPAAAITTSPHAFYEAVLLSNAVLALATAALAYLLARRLFPLGIAPAALVSAVVVLQPLSFAIAQMAMSENALIPTTILAALLLARYVECRSIANAVAAALAASFAFWISPRGILFVAAFALALVYMWLRERERPENAWLIAVTLIASLGVSALFNKALRGSHPVPGVENVADLPSVARISTWRNLVAGSAGRLGYLGVATFGLALIGLAVSVLWVARRERTAETSVPGPVVGVFASIAVLLTILASSFTMPLSHADVLYYGRYTEGVMMPLVVVGAGWLVTQTSRHSLSLMAKVAAGVSGAMLLFALMARLSPNPWPTFTEVPINVAALFGIRSVTHLSGYTGPLIVAALATGAVLLLTLVDARLALIAIVVASAVVGAPVYRDFQRPYSAQRRIDDHVAQSMGRLEQAGVTTRCVSYDMTAAAGWPLGNDVFLLPHWRFVPAGRGAGRSCRALLLTAVRPTRAGDWKLISSDQLYISAANLWIDLSAFPATMRDRLAAVQ